MKIKYWKLKMKGEQSMDQIQAAVGRGGGILLRVHFERGETQVYFAAEKSAVAEVLKGFKAAQAPTEVGVDKISKLD